MNALELLQRRFSSLEAFARPIDGTGSSNGGRSSSSSHHAPPSANKKFATNTSSGGSSGNKGEEDEEEDIDRWPEQQRGLFNDLLFCDHLKNNDNDSNMPLMRGGGIENMRASSSSRGSSSTGRGGGRQAHQPHIFPLTGGKRGGGFKFNGASAMAAAMSSTIHGRRPGRPSGSTNKNGSERRKRRRSGSQERREEKKRKGENRSNRY